ncbi:hypothetical protein [Halobaculum sp. MBLA0143]|uniref:hypothetical protein n=1 Tax=Halobaculum sp. MBLA0143 TaxID=3079933 RepID=UPI0035269172
MTLAHDPDGDDDDSPTRRAVLRGGITAIGTTLAVSSGAAAGSEVPQGVRELHEEYRDAETVESTVERFSQSTAAVFADTDPGVAEAVSSVDIEAVRLSESPGAADADEGTYLTVIERSGTLSAHITRLKRQAGVVVKHVVQPEVGRSYVLLKTPDDELIDVVDQDTELTASVLDTESVEASSCESQGYSCGPDCCNLYPCDFYVKFEKFCCRGVADGCYEEDTGSCCYPVTCC